MDTEFIAEYIPLYVEATKLTISIGLIGIALSLIVGLLIAMIQYFKLPVFMQIASVYIELSRNTPLLVQLFFLYFGLPKAGISISSQGCAIIGLCFLGGSYMAEAFHSGIESVEQRQEEAALALGFKQSQVIRYVILPQALSVSVPALCANVIFLIKETSVFSVVALADLMYVAKDLIGLYYKTDDAAADDAASGELIKVGIINNDPNESGYRTANDKDMKETFTEENGYEASFAYSLKNDEQIAAAQKFITDGVDYLLLSAADTAGWDSVLQDAKDAGVSVILFDRTIDASEDLYEASIVSDMDKEGETAVNWLADQGLDEYNVIHIQGVMGSAAQKGRSGALDDKVAAESNWNIVAQQTAEWNAEKAQQIVQSVIDSGKSFNVIYAENDDMAKGAVAALDKANISHGVGKDVIVMGFDCNKWALEELLAQNWNYDGQCNPFQASYIETIIKKLEAGESIGEKVVVMDEKGFDASTITQEDVDNYGI